MENFIDAKKKKTGKTEVEGLKGMLHIIEKDNVFKHVIQIDDNDLPMFPTAFENKVEEKMKKM